jgi:rubrerythrin
MPQPIATIEEFYSHALAIEREAAERYAEYADWFATRSDSLTQLCKRLAALEREHFEELAAACADFELPEVGLGQYRWLEQDSPEALAREFVYRVASPRQLLEIALAAELRAQAFFVWIARTAPQRSVRELAAIMAAEEGEHVTWVREAIDKAEMLT